MIGREREKESVELKSLLYAKEGGNKNVRARYTLRLQRDAKIYKGREK